MQSQSDAPEQDVEPGLPGWNSWFHIEVKRTEKLSLPQWLKKLDDETPRRKIPLLIFRQSNQPWRVTLPLEDFIHLAHMAHEAGFEGRTTVTADDVILDREDA